MVTHCYPYRHDNWAILKESLPRLTKDQVAWAPDGCDSIAGILSHMVFVEDLWINSIAELGPRIVPDFYKSDNLAEILGCYEEVRAQTEGILNGLHDADLHRVVDMPDFDEPWKPPSTPTLHWVFHHVFDHEAYHCGQIALMMRMQGVEPPAY